MIGSPGAGKTMLARRLSGILPDLTFEEALEITQVYSIAGMLNSNTPIITSRPFRSPHHTISAISLVGGGRIPKPGEISLAHNGVLFLDELPEFQKNALEVLRQPLEDRKVTINRVNCSIDFPSNITMIVALNPCKCGNYGVKDKVCICSKEQVNSYLSKISGPLLDRIDLHIEVSPVKYDELQMNNKSESSAEIKKRVNETRKIQQTRYKEHGIYSNSELTASLIEKYCILGEPEKKILKDSFDKLNLSARAYSRILKVARTIADMEKQENINVRHLAEAIQYRAIDRRRG